MEYYDLIKNRESIRNYDPDKTVDREVIYRILEAGRLAPSACNLQPWKIIIISSSHKRLALNEAYSRDWFKNAPHVLAIVGLKDKAWVRSYDGYNSLETDLAIAMTHIILAAENEGVGTCWVEAYDPEVLRNALVLTTNQEVFAITPLGYPQEGFKKKGIKTRKPIDEIVEYV